MRPDWKSLDHSRYSDTCLKSQDLKGFFDIESIPSSDNSKSSDPAELLYVKTTTRNAEGRYILNLPLKENHSLGDSAPQACRNL